MTVRVSQQVVQLAAGEAIQLHTVGEFVNLRDSQGPLLFRSDSLSAVLEEGQKIRTPTQFQGLEITNNNAGSVKATIVTGLGDFDDNSISGSIDADVQAGSTLTSTADVSLAATATAQILSVNLSRKEALITNLAGNAETLRIGDANAAAGQGIEVAPGQTITLETTAAIHAYNPNAAAQSVGVIEVAE